MMGAKGELVSHNNQTGRQRSELRPAPLRADRDVTFWRLMRRHVGKLAASCQSDCIVPFRAYRLDGRPTVRGRYVCFGDGGEWETRK